jgi:hypothetical protein
MEGEKSKKLAVRKSSTILREKNENEATGAGQIGDDRPLSASGRREVEKLEL